MNFNRMKALKFKSRYEVGCATQSSASVHVEAVLGIKDHLLLISLLSLINIPKVAIFLPKSNIQDQ